MFENINRDALILFPKQPLFDWVNYIFDDEEIKGSEPLTHDEGDVFLLPEFDHPDETIEYLKDNYIAFFKHELFEWTPDENLWPEKLTWEMFQEWFSYSIQSMVIDTLDEKIEKDEY